MRNRKPKHVIFIGAGASFTSGYPLAEGLRQEWLASAAGLTAKVRAHVNELWDNPSFEAQRFQFAEWLRPVEEALRLFREGGFGTIDEFCYLIRDAQADDVRILKRVLRLVLGVQDPEANFAKSDYYQLIQRLFMPNDLKTLRSDVVVLSFNYDPYLEWLLRRAVRTRYAALSKQQIHPNSDLSNVQALVTSGFSGGEEGLNSLVSDDGFCVLKLHGMIAWPNAGERTGGTRKRDCAFDDILGVDFESRLSALTDVVCGRSDVPIVFPWEIMAQNGELVPEPLFSFKEGPTHNVNGEGKYAGGRSGNDPNVYKIMASVWNRAREEVQASDRISFVGLSMHEYLTPGFKFLFKGKGTKIRLSLTDSQITAAETRNDLVLKRATSPYARFAAIRDACCQTMGWGPPAIYNTFEEFIPKELSP